MILADFAVVVVRVYTPRAGNVSRAIARPLQETNKTRVNGGIEFVRVHVHSLPSKMSPNSRECPFLTGSNQHGCLLASALRNGKPAQIVSFDKSWGAKPDVQGVWFRSELETKSHCKSTPSPLQGGITTLREGISHRFALSG